MKALWTTCLCLGLVGCTPESSDGGDAPPVADASGGAMADAMMGPGGAMDAGLAPDDAETERDVAPPAVDAMVPAPDAMPLSPDATPALPDAMPSPQDAAAPLPDAAPMPLDAGSPPDGPGPGEIGVVPQSCGGGRDGTGPVDCTAAGDADARCVFGDHCLCSEGFMCQVQTMWPETPECDPGSICIPAQIDRSQPTSCGGGGPNEMPVDCTAGGDVDAVCVFSDHCWCSVGFACDIGGMPVGENEECAPGVGCLPVDN